MDGFLDHLEDSGRSFSLLHKKAWTRRFFRLNEPFHLLEFFTDASLRERCGKIELRNAQVATADELGELIFSPSPASRSSSPTRVNTSAAIGIENSRRFVLRVAELAPKTGAQTLHYLCAEVPTGGGGVRCGVDPDRDDMDAGSVTDPAASRQYLDRWLRALRATALRATAPSAVAPVDLRELNATIAAFMDEMHVAVQIVGRSEDPRSGKGQYQFAVHAWILQRELVPVDEGGEEDGGEDNGGAGPEWQILEYSCAWPVAKTSADLRALDAQLRQYFPVELRDLTLPSFSSVGRLLHARGREDEHALRVALYDEYLQQLVCLPALSAFGGDGSAMLDRFFEISPHFAAFKKLEKQSGQNLQLRRRKLVPWAERERFERVYQMHLEVARAQTEKQQQQQRHKRNVASASASAAAAASARRRGSDKSAARRSSEHRHHHHHRPHSRREEEVGAIPTTPPPAAEPPVTPPSNEDSVHERIARIGHKLLVEAFQSSPSSAIAGGVTLRSPRATADS